MMLEIQQRLRELFGFNVGDEPFEWLTRRWQAFASQPVALSWDRHGGRYISEHAGYRLTIESGRAQSRRMALRIQWPGGGSRIVDRGTLTFLMARAEQIFRAGGPYGGPFSPEVDLRPGYPPPQIMLTRFERAITHDRALIAGFGAGYEVRVRPLGADVRGEHCLFLVSPTGAFVLAGFGPDYNLTPLAHFARGNLESEWRDDFHDGDDPFTVRLRGVPHRLSYTRMPGLAGHVHTDIGDVYLCLLGQDDVALILVPPGGPAECLFRGAAQAASGLELRPDEVPDALLQRPRPFTPARVAEAIGRQPRLAPAVRDHLTALARAARDELGTEYARHLVWALVAAHARGRGTAVTGTHVDVFAWVIEQGFLQTPPRERAGRGALHWLAARSPLFERTIVKRIAHWTSHVEWFSEPNTEVLARLATVTTTPASTTSY